MRNTNCIPSKKKKKKQIKHDSEQHCQSQGISRHYTVQWIIASVIKHKGSCSGKEKWTNTSNLQTLGSRSSRVCVLACPQSKRNKGDPK